MRKRRIPWPVWLATVALSVAAPGLAAGEDCAKCQRHLSINGAQAGCLERRLPSALKLTGQLVYVSLAECKGVSSGTRIDPPMVSLPKWRKAEAEVVSGYWFTRPDAECLRSQLGRRAAKAKLYDFDLSAC